MQVYSALIMDIKNSKTYSVYDRNLIQTYISHIMEVLNCTFGSAIKKNVDFSAGDEVQGLFVSPEAAYLYLRLFSMLVSPVEIRAGIGVGSWDVVMEYASSTAQDGTAYHNARHAIEKTIDSLGYSALLLSGTKDDIIINSLMNATILIINKHSEYQNELMLLSELLFPISVNGIIDCDYLKKAFGLVREKKYIVKYDYYKQRKTDKGNDMDNIYKFRLQSIPVDALNDGSTFFVTGGKQRGLASQLSTIIGVSRQSIDKTIKNANIYEARNAAVATLKLMSMSMRGYGI